MAAKNSMPERAIAQTENADLEIQQENREKLRKNASGRCMTSRFTLRIFMKEERRIPPVWNFILEWSATICR